MKRVKSNKFLGVYYAELQNGDKTYYITYKDNNNKKIWIKIGKYSEGVREAYCNQKRNEILTKQRLGEEPPAIAKKKKVSTDNTIDKLFEYYYQHKKLHNKHIEEDKQQHYNHISPIFGDTPVEKLTDEHIRELQNDKSKTHSPKTVNNILAQLNTIIEYSLKNNRIKNIENVVRKVQQLKLDNAREKYLTLKEIKRLYDAVKDDNELFIFTKLLLNTGARLQGVYNISYQDLDFTNKIMAIKDFKTNSTYRMFFNEELSELLQTRFKKNDNQLFKRSQTQLQKLLRYKLNELFNKNIDADDRKNRIVVHTLRHTFASHLAINGTPIFTIQKLMNHKDIKSTMRYAKLSPDSGRESIINLKF